MLTRIISALLGIPLLLFVVTKGGITLKVSLLALTIIAIDEFFNAFKNIGVYPSKMIGVSSAILLAVFTYIGTQREWILLWFFINMMFILAYNLFNRRNDVLSSGITALGIYYIVFFMFHIVLIADSTYASLVWMVFITAWATDTSAYFTGVFFGRTKLCPAISPKKTVEGAIGGIIGSTIMSGIFAKYFAPDLIYHGMVLGFLGSIFAQAGDLTASVFKRHAGIKDYGKIMPGHGGILDRFDSILFTAPVVYYYVILFIQ